MIAPEAGHGLVVSVLSAEYSWCRCWQLAHISILTWSIQSLSLETPGAREPQCIPNTWGSAFMWLMFSRYLADAGGMNE